MGCFESLFRFYVNWIKTCKLNTYEVIDRGSLYFWHQVLLISGHVWQTLHWSEFWNFVSIFCCREDPASPKWTPDGQQLESSSRACTYITMCIWNSTPCLSAFFYQVWTEWLVTLDQSGASDCFMFIHSTLDYQSYMWLCCILNTYTPL